MPETMNKSTHIDAKFIIRIVILNRSSKVTRNALACTIWTPQEIHPIKQRFCIKENPIFDKQKENCVCNLDLHIKIPGWGKKGICLPMCIYSVYVTISFLTMGTSNSVDGLRQFLAGLRHFLAPIRGSRDVTPVYNGHMASDSTAAQLSPSPVILMDRGGPTVFNPPWLGSKP